MKKVIGGVIAVFLMILIGCIVYEYQPHYKKDVTTEELNTEIKVVEESNKINTSEVVTNDIEDVLSTYKEEMVNEFFDKIKRDDYDFGAIQGDYREEIIKFYQNGYYYEAWKVLNGFAQFTNINPEKDGKDKIYYKLELIYLVPKDLSYCAAIYQKYDGTLESIQQYVEVMYATSNIQIYKDTDYVVLDHNFYEFIIMDFNTEKKYGETIVLQDYEITLDRNPY